MLIPTKFNGFVEGRRLYCKGGGSSKAAERMEAERQARVQAAVNAINNIFDPPARKQGINAADSFDPSKTYYNADGSVFSGAVSSGKGGGSSVPVSTSPGGKGGNGYSRYQTINGQTWDMDKVNKAMANGQLYTGFETIQPEGREKLYNEQQEAIYDLNAKEVNNQYADAERANRFALARNGLLGGSSDVESNANLQEKTNEGLVQAKALGQQAASDLRTADEQSKQNLIAMAQSGIDTGTAQQMASAQLNANAQSALGQRGGASIGNLFDNLGQAYLNRQIMNAVNNGYNYNFNNGIGNSTRKEYQGGNY
jgi:hypothetical protein